MSLSLSFQKSVVPQVERPFQQPVGKFRKHVHNLGLWSAELYSVALLLEAPT